jgi:hypothetical protein
MDGFTFELNTNVTIRISGETGQIEGRAEYSEGPDQYFVRYKAADGRAVDGWFLASQLKAV